MSYERSPREVCSSTIGTRLIEYPLYNNCLEFNNTLTVIEKQVLWLDYFYRFHKLSFGNF